MAIFLPGREQKTSTSERFARAVSAGAEGLMGHLQQKQQRQQIQQALTQRGLDPSVLDLPEAAQQAYFKQQFAQGPKPLNPLQEAQRDAALAKQKYYEENQKLFGNLMGGQPQQGPQDFQNQVMREPSQELLDQPQPKGSAQPQFDLEDPQTWPDTMISKARAFKGQPGIQGIFGNMANDEAERREKEEKTTKEKTEKQETVERDISKERTKKITEKAEDWREKQAGLRVSLDAQKDAVYSGKLGPGSPDSIAEAFNFPWLRSAAGGQFKTAGKQFFMNNVSKFGARPNMYLEQQISDMLAKIGTSPYAQLASLDLSQFELDVNDKYLQIYDDLTDKYESKPGGHLPRATGKEISKNIKPFVEQKQKDISRRLRMYQYSEDKQAPDGTVIMKNPRTGKEIYVPFREIDEAMSNGAEYPL